MGVIELILDEIIWRQCVGRREEGSQSQSGEHTNFRIQQGRTAKGLEKEESEVVGKTGQYGIQKPKKGGSVSRGRKSSIDC